MAYLKATLGTLTLPVQFSYKPAVPVKRTTKQEVAGGVVIHDAPYIVQEDSTIEWDIDTATQAEWVDLLELYNDDANPTLRFTGYYGDVMDVKMFSMDSPSITGRMFSFGGLFLVTAVIRWGWS